MADFALGQACRTFTSDRGSTSSGVTVTSSTTINTMGAFAELDASTEEEAVGLKISILKASVVGSSTLSFLMNIGIGPATEEVLIEGIHFAEDNTDTNHGFYTYEFPVSIAKGSRITAQCQSNSTDADSVNILAEFIVGSFESSPGYGGIVSYGVNSSTSNGTTVDPGTSANTLGAWAELVDPCEELKGFTLSMGFNARTSISTNSTIFEIGIGATGTSGDEVVIAAGMSMNKGTFESASADTCFRNVSIPDGARLVVRSQCSDGNAGLNLSSIVFHGAK